MPRHDGLKDTHWITLAGRAVKKLKGELSCQEGFEAIKSELMELALRYQPDPSKPYMCTTDASLYGIGMSIHVQCDETKAWLPVVIQSETAEFNDCWCTLMGIKQTMTTVARSSKANAMAEITIQYCTVNSGTV